MILPKPILWYVVKWSSLVLAVSLSSLLLILIMDPHGKSEQEVKLVSPGMSLANIESVLKRPPEFFCRFRGCKIVYYRSQGLGEAEYTLPTEVDSPSDIPELYDSVQILVNKDIAVAITWMGERLTIDTSEGPFGGSSVSQLPEEFLDCHCE